MAGRRGASRPRRRPRAKQVKVPTNMYVADTTFDVSAKVALTNNLFTLFDNSGTAGNKTIMFTKFTFSWVYYGGDSYPFVIAIGRQKEGGVALDLDDAPSIRDYINENHMLRGPWMMVTKPLVEDQKPGGHKHKTMVFKKLMLDANDDLVMHYSPLITHTSGEKFHIYYKAFYRIVD